MIVLMDPGSFTVTLLYLAGLVIGPILVFCPSFSRLTRILGAYILFCLFFAFPSLIYSFHRSGFVLVKPDAMHSHSFFGKKKCRVDLTKQVFYAQFQVEIPNRFGASTFLDFFALSNHPFCYQTSDPSNRAFLEIFDQKRIIAMPYNDRTKKLLDTEHWINVKW